MASPAKHLLNHIFPALAVIAAATSCGGEGGANCLVEEILGHPNTGVYFKTVSDTSYLLKRTGKEIKDTYLEVVYCDRSCKDEERRVSLSVSFADNGSDGEVDTSVFIRYPSTLRPRPVVGVVGLPDAQAIYESYLRSLLIAKSPDSFSIDCRL